MLRAKRKIGDAGGNNSAIVGVSESIEQA